VKFGAWLTAESHLLFSVWHFEFDSVDFGIVLKLSYNKLKHHGLDTTEACGYQDTRPSETCKNERKVYQ